MSGIRFLVKPALVALALAGSLGGCAVYVPPPAPGYYGHYSYGPYYHRGYYRGYYGRPYFRGG